MSAETDHSKEHRERRPRTAKRGGLFVNDAELIELLGVPEDIARAAINKLDCTPGSGFPPKRALWGNRRYWPAVRAYFDATELLKLDTQRLRRVS